MLDHDQWIQSFAKALSKLDGRVYFDLVPDEEQRDNNERLRPSSLGDCARQQWYRVTNAIVTNHPEYYAWPSLMGYAGQAIIAEALVKMGYQVTDQEATVEYRGLRGHIDGLVTGGDVGTKRVIWDSKIRSTFGYRSLLKGLPESDRTMYVQQMLYITAAGADFGMVTVVPFDFSTNRSQMAQYKVEGDPRANRIIIEPNAEHMELIDTRIDMLDFAIDNKIVPAREYDPNNERLKFPCPFCLYRDLCKLEGDGDGYVVQALPEEWAI